MDTWTRSSYSNNSGGECVEARVSDTSSRVEVRDSQNPGLGYLVFDPAEWRVFLTEVDGL